MKKLFAILCVFTLSAGFSGGSWALDATVSAALNSTTCKNTGPATSSVVISSGNKDTCVVDNCSGYKLTCDNDSSSTCYKVGEGVIIANRFGYITKCGKWGTWGDSAWGWGGAGKDTPNMCKDFTDRAVMPANAEGITGKESGVPCWRWQCKSPYVWLEEGGSVSCIAPADCRNKKGNVYDPNARYTVSDDGKKCVPFTGCVPPKVLYGVNECKTEAECAAIKDYFVSKDKTTCMTCTTTPATSVQWEGTCVSEETCNAKSEYKLNGKVCEKVVCDAGKLIKSTDKSCVTADDCTATPGCVVSGTKYCTCGDAAAPQPGEVGGCPAGLCRQATDTGDNCTGSIQETTAAGQYADSSGKCQKCPTNYFPTYNADNNTWRCVAGLIAYASQMRACWDCTSAAGFKRCVKTNGADRGQCGVAASDNNANSNNNGNTNNNNTQTITCGPGEYIVAGASKCSPCVAGWYCDGKGTYWPVSIPAKQSYGSTPCAAGTTSDAGATYCKPKPPTFTCPDGYKNDAGNTDKNKCYKDCPLDTGALTMSGRITYDGTNTCKVATCDTANGYTLSRSGTCVKQGRV